MKGFFFLKVWAKNMGVHYTWQNMVYSIIITILKLPPKKKEKGKEGRACVPVEDKEYPPPRFHLFIYNIVSTLWHPTSSLPTCDTVVDSVLCKNIHLLPSPS